MTIGNLTTSIRLVMVPKSTKPDPNTDPILHRILENIPIHLGPYWECMKPINIASLMQLGNREPTLSSALGVLWAWGLSMPNQSSVARHGLFCNHGRMQCCASPRATSRPCSRLAATSIHSKCSAFTSASQHRVTHSHAIALRMPTVYPASRSILCQPRKLMPGLWCSLRTLML